MQKQIHLAPQTAEEDAYAPSSAISTREFKILRKRVAEDKAQLLAQITVTADQIQLMASKTYVDGIKANLEASITVNAEAITLKASQSELNSLGNRVTTAESTLTIQAGEIATKVSTTDLNSALTNYSTITQTSTAISTYVGTNVYTKDEINTTLGSYSTITQTAASIATRVATTDYNGNTIASLINQTATTIQISAEKLNLNGFVTLTNLTDGATTISGANIKTGNISATSVTIGGWRLSSSQIYKGAIKLDSANERIYLNSSAFLYAYADTSFIGVSGGLVASAHIGGTYFGATSGSKYAEYNTSNIVCRDGANPVALQMNGSNIITRANFSLSGTTLTITM